MIALGDLERAFQAYVLDESGDFLDHVAEGRHLGASDLALVYFSAYRGRLIEVLAAEYEVLSAHLGDQFEALALEFIAANPSKCRNLRWYSPGFADHLEAAGHNPAAAIARFERALRDAFDAEDVPIATVEELAAIPHEDWGALIFTFHPSVRSLRLDWSAPALWQDQPIEALDRPQDWLIWRDGLMPKFREIDEIEACAYDAARSGATFDRICARIAERIGEDEAPARAAIALRNWIEPGLIAALGTVGRG